jgi:hypothetical protein
MTRRELLAEGGPPRGKVQYRKLQVSDLRYWMVGTRRESVENFL